MDNRADVPRLMEERAWRREALGETHAEQDLGIRLSPVKGGVSRPIKRLVQFGAHPRLGPLWW